MHTNNTSIRSSVRFPIFSRAARFGTLLRLTTLAIGLVAGQAAWAGGHGGGESSGPAPMQFVVNVNGAQGASGFLQVSMVLSPASPEATHEFDLYKPMLMHYIGLVISSFSAETLRSVKGKEKLADAIAERVNKELGFTRKNGVAEVFFTSFILQA